MQIRQTMWVVAQIGVLAAICELGYVLAAWVAIPLPGNLLGMVLLFALQLAFDHRCAYCDRRRKGRLTQDHVTPLSKGGSHTASNIVPACASCNSRKHTGPPLRPVQPMLL